MVYLKSTMKKEKLKLLLVEDEPDICTAVQSYFGKRGFSVSTTGSGREALSMMKSSAPDLILLDISLHDLSGVEVLKQLREYDQETKVIIITGQLSMNEDVRKIFDLGISGYRHKPLIIEEFARVVYEVLDQAPIKITPAPIKKEKFSELSNGAIVHQLSNFLAIIRNKCENFTLNVEDGIYKDKSPQELLKMSVEIMKDVEDTVDKTMEVVEQIRENKKV